MTNWLTLHNVGLELQNIFKQEGLPTYYNTALYITETSRYLVISDCPQPIIKLEGRPVRVRYITPDGSDLLSLTGLVDINAVGWVPCAANYGKSDRGERIFVFEKSEQGQYILIPFNVTEVLKHRGATIKGFFAYTPKIPYERVAVTDKGGVRRLIIGAIQEIFRSNGIPYVRISYVPGFSPSLFGIRIDTDFCSLGTIKEAAAFADKMGMRWTWFINVGAITSNLKELKEILAGHDIQIHCYRHWVYDRVEENIKNISAARMLLNKHGINPIGVAGPYGHWNVSFQRALEQLGVEYSSEFGYSYDDVPGRPVINNQESPVTQIPVHPISTGRLAWAKATPKTILKYYQSLIDRQVARREPCFLYDHPDWIVRNKELWREIIQYGRERCGTCATLTEYYSWWRARERCSYTVAFRGHNLEINTSSTNGEVALVINYNRQNAFVPLITGKINLNDLIWTPITCLKFNPLERYTRKLPLRYFIYEKIREKRKQLIFQKEKKERGK